jgi:hypothetical protein
MTPTDARTHGTLIAVGWLFVLHALADIAVALYRCHDVDSALTDVLSTALPISQLWF